jgi:hypothetical protein
MKIVERPAPFGDELVEGVGEGADAEVEDEPLDTGEFARSRGGPSAVGVSAGQVRLPG